MDLLYWKTNRCWQWLLDHLRLWHPSLTSFFDICPWHQFLTSVLDIRHWHPSLTSFFDILPWHQFLTSVLDVFSLLLGEETFNLAFKTKAVVIFSIQMHTMNVNIFISHFLLYFFYNTLLSLCKIIPLFPLSSNFNYP